MTTMAHDDDDFAIWFEEDPSWRDRAECRTVPKEVFFPGRGQSTEKAKEICAGCPVRVECREYSLRSSRAVGVWGGTSQRERDEKIRGWQPKRRTA